jgi:hypothetical protein
VTLDGTRRPFRLRLARRLWETEQYYQAMNEWRSVLGQDPGNLEARLGLARGAAKAGDRAEAAQEICAFSGSPRISRRPGGSWPVWVEPWAPSKYPLPSFLTDDASPLHQQEARELDRYTVRIEGEK